MIKTICLIAGPVWRCVTFEAGHSRSSPRTRRMPLARSRFSAVVLAATGFVVPAIALSGQARKAKDTAAAHRTATEDSRENKPDGAATEGKQPAAKSRSELLAAQRFELIKRRVAAAEIRSDEPDFPTRFAAEPIFRYSDLARGHVAAAVWKLGDEGRPKAILSTELDRFSTGRPCICHEYSSLTTTRFSITLDGMRWTACAGRLPGLCISSNPFPTHPPRKKRRGAGCSRFENSPNDSAQAKW
ncbi:MAG TPA: hypothetical protein VG826_14415 [Pirellulales bacterium]|nr:hypothetical protein [Pirellulales bacterium]